MLSYAVFLQTRIKNMHMYIHLIVYFDTLCFMVVTSVLYIILPLYIYK